MKLSDIEGQKLMSLLSDLKPEATGFVRTCDEVSPILAEFKAYMRSTGQGWEIPIELTEEQAMNPDPATFEARFIEDYSKLFGRPVAGMDIEITVWSVNATTPPETVARIAETVGANSTDAAGERRLFDAASGKYLDAKIVNRSDMVPGDRSVGPVAVVEDETTIIVPASRDAICQPDGCIDVITKEVAQ
jgi:N-methylhydantoinase A